MGERKEEKNGETIVRCSSKISKFSRRRNGQKNVHERNVWTVNGTARARSTEANSGAILAWKNSRRINIQGGLNGRTFGASFVCLQIYRDNSLWFDKRHVSVDQLTTRTRTYSPFGVWSLFL